MAITEINTSIQEIDKGVSVTASLPTGSIEDDIVIVGLANDNPVNPFITSTGWTSIHYFQASPQYELAYKRQGATPDTTIDFDLNSSRSTLMLSAIFRGVDPTTAEDGTSNRTNDSGGFPQALPLTTETAGSLRVIYGVLDDEEIIMTAPVRYTDGTTLARATGDFSPDTTFGVSSIMAFQYNSPAGLDTPDAFGGPPIAEEPWQALHVAFLADPAGPAPEALRQIGKMYSFG